MCIPEPQGKGPILKYTIFENQIKQTKKEFKALFKTYKAHIHSFHGQRCPLQLEKKLVEAIAYSPSGSLKSQVDTVIIIDMPRYSGLLWKWVLYMPSSLSRRHLAIPS